MIVCGSSVVFFFVDFLGLECSFGFHVLRKGMIFLESFSLVMVWVCGCPLLLL